MLPKQMQKEDLESMEQRVHRGSLRKAQSETSQQDKYAEYWRCHAHER